MTGSTLGAYAILEKLGAGGMGEVFKARHVRLNRVAAIKILPPGRAGDEERRKRFLQEAQSASALNHPNIITIYDIDSSAGVDFIAMEYVAGRSLEQILAAGRLSPAEARGYAAQVAGALEAAHAAGIVHRDLKPGNIMITPAGQIKLLDFGLAKLARPGTGGPQTGNSSTQTIEGVIVGTVAYMSPEQAEGKPVDTRSDIFSFGAVLYEMLTGRRAFEGHSAISTLSSVLRDHPAPVAELCPEVPAELDQLVMRCLRKAARLRPQTMTDVKAALESGLPAAADRVSEPAPAPPPSIAVLPFANLSGDPENDYFGDGLAEEIINALTRLPGLKVAARTSAFRFRGSALDIAEVGEKLKVDHVLEGSVRKAGNRIRVTTQVIKIADGFHVWSERFDRELTDVFAIQDEISQAIVEKLRVNLGAVSGRHLVRIATPNLEAYTALLEGRYHHSRFTVDGLKRAKASYERAIALDPGFAPAYSGLADFFSNQAILGFVDPKAVMPQALLAVHKALALEENDADAHSTLGIIHAIYEHDWRGAQAEFLRAIELNPASTLARRRYAMWLLRPLSRLDEAAAEAEKAVELDPLSPYAWVIHTFMAYCRGHYDDALARTLKTLELDPQYYWAYLLRTLSFIGLNALAEAAASAAKLREVLGDAPMAIAVQGLVDAAAGRLDAAREAISRLQTLSPTRYVSPHFLGWLYSSLRDPDAAFEWLDRGYAARDPWVITIHSDPLLDSLKGDARMKALSAKLALH